MLSASTVCFSSGLPQLSPLPLVALVSDVIGANCSMQTGANVAHWFLSIPAHKRLNNICQVLCYSYFVMPCLCLCCFFLM